MIPRGGTEGSAVHGHRSGRIARESPTLESSGVPGPESRAVITVKREVRTKSGRLHVIRWYLPRLGIVVTRCWRIVRDTPEISITDYGHLGGTIGFERACNQ